MGVMTIKSLQDKPFLLFLIDIETVLLEVQQFRRVYIS